MVYASGRAGQHFELFDSIFDKLTTQIILSIKQHKRYLVDDTAVCTRCRSY